jgi:hypothetical protein
MEMNRSTAEWEELFPLEGVDDGFILSKRGDVTVGWELTLPAAFTVGGEGYDAITRAMASAVRALPDWSIVHRQDIYLLKAYEPDAGRTSFLGSAYERHFAGRPYMQARHFLYLTFSSRASALRGTGDCGLFGLGLPGRLPKEGEVREWAARAEEFISVALSGGPVRARRLTDADLVGEGGADGLIGTVMSLGGETLSDIALSPDSVRVNDERTVSFILSDSSDLPSSLENSRRVESMSGTATEVNLSLASPVGLAMLSHPHMYNLYIVKASQQGVLSDLQKRTRRMRQFATDGANAQSADENDEFVQEYNRGSLTAVRAHANVILWGRDAAECQRIRSDASAALSSMGVSAVRDIHSAPVLWYASIPGAEAELSKEHLMLTELNAALSLMQCESYDSGLERGALKFTDRLRHIPLTLDVQAEAERANLISNYNIFLNGASGTGKSFTTASMLYNMWAAGEHVFIIDVGGSYEQVCAIVNAESGGRDGIYNRWDLAHPFSFSPFRTMDEWTGEDGGLRRDHPALNFLVSLLTTLGTDRDKGVILGDFEEKVILYLLQTFMRDWNREKEKRGRTTLPFPLFSEFVSWTRAFLIRSEDEADGRRGTMRAFLSENGVRVDETLFDGPRFVESLSAYGEGGQYGFLLNAEKPTDLFSSRFTVFDMTGLDRSGDKFYSLCVLCIVNAFDLKMRSSDIPEFKVLAIDEAWKAISNETMAPYLRELWKTARKMSTSAMVITQELDDILSSSVIRETILQNSDIKILMNQDGNRNAFGKVSGPMGLSQGDVNLIFSMAGRKQRSRDVFIKWGSARSGVYTVEACREQLWAFESNLQKKRPLLELTERTGSMTRAIEELASQGKTPQ